MQILSSPQNKENGFTILECILAIGILSVFLASIVGLQSSVVYVAQESMNKLKSVWTTRQALAQLEYVLDSEGMDSLEKSTNFVWSADPRFSATVTKKDLDDIKLSDFLITALKFYNMTNSNGDTNVDIDRTLAPIAALLDSAASGASASSGSSVPINTQSSNFINVTIDIAYQFGNEKKSFKNALFLINNNAFSNIKLPSSQSGSSGNQGENQNTPQPPPSKGENLK